MKHLVLHVGAHKTGTTLVQKALRANRAAFAERGYDVLTRNEYEDVTQGYHVRWRRQGGDLQNVTTAFELLRDSLTHDSLVLSHEDLLASVHSFRTGPLYAPAGEVLRRALDVLRPERTTVLFAVRRQDRFVESSYLQTVRVGSTKTFSEFMAPVIPENLRWDVLVETMRAALPADAELHLTYFESIKELRARNFVREFFRQTGVGVSPEFTFNTDAVNRGYSDVALKLALVGNAELEPEDRRKLRLFLDASFSNATHPSPLLLTPGQREEMLTALAPFNKALHEMVTSSLSAGSPDLAVNLGESPYLPGAR
ncbi:hypothetical protein ACFQBY_13810 [Promicromonospora citrea]|uniref:Sulfotransferase family protein n=1 Tax=Promicromonospora citrea TaxID=43677 RepID=A0A8H9GHK7_9MICO|nr:hypothetical protein [Promicromonospora citrea]NNH53736.1 hypothetical protein [Promicromonospora citrea]GGM27597.1 hypothetical protein GCM10010102_24090 [Promicromonospora citrea]